MALGSLSNYAGPQITPEERQLKNERSRVNSFIRSYERNPDTWNPSMIASLEKLALQYQIPFRRHIPQKSVIHQAGAFLGGIADGIAFDLLPDKWYSSEGTRAAKNWGKGAGVVGSALVTGGATLGAKGALAGGKLLGSKALAKGATALGSGKGVAGGLGKAVSQYTPSGIATRKGIETVQKVKGAASVGGSKKLADSKAIIESVKKGNIGDVNTLLKGRSVARDSIDDVVKVVNKEFGKGSAAANKIIKNIKASTQTGLNLGKDKIKGLVNKIAGRSESVTKSVNVTGKEMTKFITNAGRRQKMSSAEIKDLLKVMKYNNIKNLDESADFILNSGKSSSEILSKAMSWADLKNLDKMDLAKIAGAGLLTTRPLTGIAGSGGITPSRAELEADDLDIYNPY